MSNRCEQLRSKAIAAGLSSKDAMIWRVHCKSCENCRTELFILETLQRQSTEEHRHLPSGQVARLLREVKNRGIRSRRRSGLRIAANVVFALFVTASAVAVLSGNSDAPLPTRTIVPQASGESATAGWRGSAAALFSQFPIRFSRNLNEPAKELPAADVVQEKLDSLRARVNMRREDLSDLCESDDDGRWINIGFPGI